MAILLVCAEDRPVPDSPGRWYRGMPVHAFEDDHEFGRKEGPPWNLLFHFPRISREELSDAFCQLDEEEEPNPIGQGKVVSTYARRKQVFDASQMEDAERKPSGKKTHGAKSAIVIRTDMMEDFPRDAEKRKPNIRVDK